MWNAAHPRIQANSSTKNNTSRMAFRNIENPSTPLWCRRGANPGFVKSCRMENSQWRGRCTVLGQLCFWEKDLLFMKKIAIASCVGFMMVGALSAQEHSHFGFNIGAGFTQAVGDTGQ